MSCSCSVPSGGHPSCPRIPCDCHRGWTSLASTRPFQNWLWRSEEVSSWEEMTFKIASVAYSCTSYSILRRPRASDAVIQCYLAFHHPFLLLFIVYYFKFINLNFMVRKVEFCFVEVRDIKYWPWKEKLSRNCRT